MTNEEEIKLYHKGEEPQSSPKCECYADQDHPCDFHILNIVKTIRADERDKSRKIMLNIISEDLENGIIIVDENKLNKLQDKVKSKEGLP